MGPNGHIIFISNDYNAKAICEPNWNTNYWSMEKLAWVTFKNQPKLPTNFSIVGGCGLSVERQKVVLIGGHRNIETSNGWLLGNYLPNDQVLMYDFLHETWTWLTNIPLGNLWPAWSQAELKCSVAFNKIFET